MQMYAKQLAESAQFMLVSYCTVLPKPFFSGSINNKVSKLLMLEHLICSDT